MTLQQDVPMEEVSDHPLVESVATEGDAMEAEVPAIQETGTAESKPVDDEYFGTYEWRLENFSKIQEMKRYSEKFEIGTYIWRMLIFPRGNKVPQLSVYLDAPEAAFTPLSMSPKAAFKLVMINHLDPSKCFHKETQHTFTQSETDWGFTQFFSVDEVLNPKNGWLSADDTLVLRVEIQVQKDERYAYDSRKETNYVGLKNQGATCYMNSLLQYMYNLPYFRKAVYHMPTAETDEPSKSLPLALQSLFYKLQYSKTSVSTKDLTKSFGWGTYDAFMQHDVQELNRVLCEKLEEKMKGTKVEKVINELFEGHTNNFIECVNVDYKSNRKESFMDLQLDVKGCRNIYDSFDKYTEVEMLDGANQYKAEGHGLQDARKGVLFEDFPPVLQLQLKRFEYDFQRDTMIKINDRYEFFEELDLDREDGKYLAPGADKSVRNLYKLHSVLVHSGGVHGGHYYAFIRPDGQQWLKFDDERVTIEDSKKALDEQFGGEDENPPPGGFATAAPPFKFTKYSNAYMLVYIRLSDWDRIMTTVNKTDIQEHLRERLEQEQLEKEQRQKEKAEAHLYCTIKVASDAHLAEQVGSHRYFDLVDHDRLLPDKGCFRVRKNTKFSEFKKMVAEKMGVPVEKQRYWTWARRQNGTYRPSHPLRPEEEELPLMDLREHREQGAPASKASLMDLKLFLETPRSFTGDAGGELHPRGKHEMLLFIKHYDPETQTLRYAGRGYFHRNSKLADIMDSLCLICGLPQGSTIEAYEEIKFEPSVMVDVVDKKSLLGSGAQLEDGDILCVQRVVDPETAAKYKHPTVKVFLEYIRARRLVNFRKLEEPKEPGFTLELLKDMGYDQVCQAVAEHLGLPDPSSQPVWSKVRLTQHNAYSHQPQRSALRFQGMARLEAMLQHGNHVNDILYYELLDMPLDQLEQLKTLRVAFHNAKSELVAEHSVRLPRDSSVGDVLAELSKQLGPEVQGKPLRLMEVYNSKLYKILDPKEPVDQMNENYWILRAEVVPEEQVAPGEDQRLIHCYHFQQDKENPSHITHFGDPFLLLIKDDQPLSSIKAQIQEKLGVADEEFGKWQFAFVSIRSSPEFFNDDDIVGERFAKAQNPQTSEVNYLGLQHEDKAPRRVNNSYRSAYEKPVKINC